MTTPPTSRLRAVLAALAAALLLATGLVVLAPAVPAGAQQGPTTMTFTGRGLGLSAPEVLGEDLALGLLLVEDLGEATHAALLDAGADPLPLYTAAA